MKIRDWEYVKLCGEQLIIHWILKDFIFCTLTSWVSSSWTLRLSVCKAFSIPKRTALLHKRWGNIPTRHDRNLCKRISIISYLYLKITIEMRLLKVRQSRKKIMVASILPKNELWDNFQHIKLSQRSLLSRFTDL